MSKNVLKMRPARAADLPAIVAMLADDPLGATREELREPLPDAYLVAFAAISDDSNQMLAVAERDGVVVGTLQLTFLPGLARKGWSIEECRQRGCDLVQLTSDNARPNAHRFYEALGFVASHAGFKLTL
jgi:GNAT superfamily N-acetyltransferase